VDFSRAWFRLLERFKTGYGHRKKKAFFKDITREFKKLTGKDHQILERVVDRECKKREEYLESIGTREEP